MKTYTFHEDPAHGWLEVDRQELIDLDILDQITPFSYQKGDKVYLEEDCDYSTFCDAIRTRPDEITKRYNGDAPMRSYESFKQ